jgi:hypothetical protein
MQRAVFLDAKVVAGGLVGGVLLWRRLRNWGATTAELTARYPGDDLVADPADVAALAVTVDAPAGEVWRWLVQMGKGRGGMYSYDWLENLIGLDIHTTNEIRDEWQHLAAGDRVEVVPNGWLGMKGGYAFPVARVDPGRAIVLRQAPPEHPWDSVWTFVVEPRGPERCRLISHTRTHREDGAGARLVRLLTAIGDPIVVVMTRKMLLGIKVRAERHHRERGDRPPVPTGRPVGSAV